MNCDIILLHTMQKLIDIQVWIQFPKQQEFNTPGPWAGRQSLEDLKNWPSPLKLICSPLHPKIVTIQPCDGMCPWDPGHHVPVSTLWTYGNTVSTLEYIKQYTISTYKTLQNISWINTIQYHWIPVNIIQYDAYSNRAWHLALLRVDSQVPSLIVKHFEFILQLCTAQDFRGFHPLHCVGFQTVFHAIRSFKK